MSKSCISRYYFLFISLIFTLSTTGQVIFPDNVDSVNCETSPSATIFGIQQEYKSKELVYLYAHTLVGDLNGDGKSEIVTLGSTASYRTASGIKIFDNQLNLIRSINTPLIYAYSTMPFALAKVDQNALQGQIVIAVAYNSANAASDQNVLKCYNYDGTLLWTSDPYYNPSSSSNWDVLPSTIGFADFNGDGVPEVYIYNRIYNAQTGKLLAQGSDTESMGITAMSVDAGSTRYACHPVAADVNGDGLPELIAGNVVYKVSISNISGTSGNSISVLTRANAVAGVGDGFTSVADLDLDGNLDVVVTRRYSATQNCLYAWNPQTGALIGSPVFVNWVGPTIIAGPSQPFIGDIDGDNYPEVCFTTEYRLHAYKYNAISKTLVSKWTNPLITSDASGATALTLFDFNQDGKAELIYRDMTDLRIIDGSGLTPVTIQSIPCASPTAVEYPVVADINNDGSAEIIVSGNDAGANPAWLNVYGAASGKWAPARPVWNQYQYNVINVNKDLTIPKIQFNPAKLFPNGKRPFNAFLQQATTIDQNGNPYVALPKDTTRIDTSILKGQSYSFGTKTYATSVRDTLRLKNSSNCDSTVILNLLVLDLPDNVDSANCFITPTATTWGMKLFSSSSAHAHRNYTPLAGDLDGDGIPEIVAVSDISSSLTLTVFAGNNLSKYVSQVVSPTPLSTFTISPFGLIRVADKTNPGKYLGLIIVRTDNGLKSYKLENINNSYNLSLIATNNFSVPDGAVSFADFNNDGIPEVYIGNCVFDVYTLDKIAIGSSNSGKAYMHSMYPASISFAADVLPEYSGTELICGNQIYSVDITNKTLILRKTITPPSGFNSDGQIEVADFDGDGLLDVLVREYNNQYFRIWAYNPRLGTVLFSKQVHAETNPGAVTPYQNYPLIGDIDGDKKPEIVLIYSVNQALTTTDNFMVAYKCDYNAISKTCTLNKFWDYQVKDPSGSTGATLFDFNQDGIKEIVYRDEQNLRIIDGSKTLNSVVYDIAVYPCTSTTTAEHPIVLDCDADGEAEIVTIGSYTRADEDGGRIRIFKSNGSKWAPARPVWNQYAYNVTNVNKDLTIPSTIFNNAAFFPNGKQPFNNFQEQATMLNRSGDMFFKALSDTTRIDITIHNGQSYVFGTKTYTTAVKDTLHLKNAKGCDSLVVLNLNVNPTTITALTDSFCVHSSYFYRGKTITVEGVYIDTLTSILGNDSIVILTLTYKHPIQVTLNSQICKGTSYNFGGTSLKATGTYQHNLITVGGCDSIVTLNLTVNPPITTALTDSFCVHGSYFYRGKTITTAGIYTDTLSTLLGCDSIVTLTLSYRQPKQVILNRQICEGKSYDFEGTLLNATGTYTHSFVTVAGCDSTITLNLTVNPPIITALTDSFCVHGSYFYRGKTITTAGIYTDTLSTSLGCDSIVTLTLLYRQPKQVILNRQMCEGKSYDFEGTLLNATGTYTHSFVTVDGCDSTITLNLTVNPPITTALTDSFCVHGSYFYRGKTITTAGIYTDTLSTSLGCDSIVTLTLSYRHPIQVTLNRQICEGTSYNFGGTSLKATGSYQHNLVTVGGCDSIVTLNLTVNPPITTALTDNFCVHGSYFYRGKTITTAGVYTDTLSTPLGCDSIVTLTLSYRKPIQVFITRQICEGENYNFEGTLLTTTGTYTHNFITNGGCDSIITVNMKVIQPVTTTLNIVINEGESYFFGGDSLKVQGIYKNTLKTSLNCDSIIILNLLVLKQVLIPEIFTPNGDGANDYFEIKNIEQYPKNHILILNRWGNKIFEAKPYLNDWDGRAHFGVTAGNGLLPVGTYFYIFDLGNGTPVRKGFIYLNR